MTDSDDARARWRPFHRIEIWRGERRSSRALEKARQSRSDRTAPSRRPTGEHSNRRNAAMLGAVGASLAVISLLFLGPGSINTWMSQRRQTQTLNAKIDTLDKANAALTERQKQLKDPQTIAYLARRNYGMVPKGSKSYAILPSPQQSAELDGTWPFIELSRDQASPHPDTEQSAPATVP